MMSARFVLAATLFFTASAAAQSRFVEVSLMARIEAIADKNGERLLVLERGEDFGLRVGVRGEVRPVQPKAGLGAVVAMAEIVAVTPRSATARLIPGHGSHEEAVTVGGVVDLQTVVPSTTYQGVLFAAVRHDIDLLDNQRRPLFSELDVFRATDASVEDAALRAFGEATREVVSFTREMKDPIRSPRFAGRVVPDVLERGDPEDLRAFLRFVRDFPGKYIGQDYKLSEVFATWLINGAPEAHEDLEATLHALDDEALTTAVQAMRPPDFEAFVVWLAKQIPDGSESAFGGPVSRLAWARRLVAASKRPSRLLDARLATAEANLPGLTPRERAKRHAAEAKAYARAKLLGEALIALNNRANALRDAEAFDEALEVYAEVQSAARAAIASAADPQEASQLEVRVAYAAYQRADIFRRRGEHAAVVRELEPEAETFGRAVYVGARRHQIEILQRLANARGALGDDAGAIALLERISGLARDLGDTQKESELWMAIGDLHHARSRWSEALVVYTRAVDLARSAGSDRFLARSLGAAGQVLWQLGRLKEALERHDEGLAIRRRLGDRDGLAWQLVEAGRVRAEMGDRATALAWLEEALALRAGLGQRGEEGEVRLELARLNLARSEPERAERDFQAALDLFDAVGLAPGALRAAEGLTRSALRRGDLPRALAAAKRAVKTAERMKQPPEVARVRVLVAAVKRAMGQRVEARRELAIAGAQGQGDAANVVSVALALAALDLDEGLVDAADAQVTRALAASKKANDPAAESSALAFAASVARARGAFSTALEKLDAAIAVATASGNRPAAADLIGTRAWTLADLGRLTEAAAAAAEAARLAEAIADDVLRGWAENTQARVARSRGQKAEERAHYDAGLALMEKAGFGIGRATLTLNRAILDAELRDTEAALRGFQDALALAGPQADVDFTMVVAEERAQTLRVRGDLAAAEAGFREVIAKARQVSPGRVPDFLSRLGETLLEAGRAGEALTVFQEAAALEKATSKRLFTAEGWVGVVLARLGRDGEAEVTLSAALNRAKRTGAGAPWELLAELGAVQDRLGQSAKAIASLEAAVAAIEALGALLGDTASRERFHADKLDVYRRLVKLLLSGGRVDDALRLLERAKATELRDLDRKTGSSSDASAALALELEVQESRMQALVDQELAREKPNRRKVDRLDGLLQSARRRRAAFVEALDRDNALFDRYSVRPLHLESLQAHLEPGVLLISPLALDGQLVVFAVTRTTMTHFSTAEPTGGLAAAIDAFRAALDPEHAAELGDDGLNAVKLRARTLYDCLLGPAFRALGVPRELVVSASGPLRYVPFAALYDGERWVAERTVVRTATALDREKFADGGGAGGPPRTLLAVADPDGTLPGARLEVAAVQGLFDGSRVLEGEAATLSELRARSRSPGYDVLHFATHGTLDAARPEASHIVLAGAPLTYADIPTLTLSATKLVVLSACDTASTTGGTGVEIAGLAYQFQRTHVGSVLATLWAVDDAATAKLIQGFYERVKGGAGYAVALAEAQRGLITDPDAVLRHPAFWGPFVLMGRP